MNNDTNLYTQRNILIRNFLIFSRLAPFVTSLISSILKIHEICQPCNYLQKKLNSPNLVKKLINKSGVRAEILSSGYIEVGSKIIKIK